MRPGGWREHARAPNQPQSRSFAVNAPIHRDGGYTRRPRLSDPGASSRSAVPCASMQAQSDDSLLGRTLAGKYRIVELLGRGGMASVYRCTHDGADPSELAIKILD